MNPNRGGLQDRFEMCVKEYGDQNARDYLTLEGYLSAQKAASDAGISTAEELALWENENSLRSDTTLSGSSVWTPGPRQEIGPMQIRPIAAATLGSRLPAGWNTNALANMIAAGRIYAWILSLPEPTVPRSEAAAAYNGGTRVRGTGDNRHRRYKGIRSATAYQKSFDQHREMLDKVDQCMKTGR